MKIQVAIGKTEGFLSSIGFGLEGIPFMARNLHWKGVEERNKSVKTLVLFLHKMKEAGFEIEGVEEAEAELAKLEKKSD